MEIVRRIVARVPIGATTIDAIVPDLTDRRTDGPETAAARTTDTTGIFLAGTIDRTILNAVFILTCRIMGHITDRATGAIRVIFALSMGPILSSACCTNCALKSPN